MPPSAATDAQAPTPTRLPVLLEVMQDNPYEGRHRLGLFRTRSEAEQFCETVMMTQNVLYQLQQRYIPERYRTRSFWTRSKLEDERDQLVYRSEYGTGEERIFAQDLDLEALLTDDGSAELELASVMSPATHEKFRHMGEQMESRLWKRVLREGSKQ